MPFRLVRFPAFFSPRHSVEVAADNECDGPSLSQVLRSKMPSLRMSLFHISVVGAVLLSSLGYRSFASQTCSCQSHDQPNPIATTYPNNATGVLNATLAVVPIPLTTAREIIPAKYGILEHAYRALLPDFPEGMYPMLIQAGHDHDIQLAALSIHIPDFMRAGFEFPFLDLLGDGYSSFRYHPFQLIEASNSDAIVGSRAYGTTVEPSAFDPLCDAYRAADHGARYFRGMASNDSSIFLQLEFWPLSSGEASPFPVEFFKNVTNQPSFANGSTCDSQIRLFHTALSEGEFAPVQVRGQVTANLPPVQGKQGLGDIYGVEVTTPFIENNYLDCQTLKGFEGVDLPGY